MGAELILIPTVNTKAEPSEMFEWELRVQAFHTSVAIAICNRVGREGGHGVFRRIHRGGCQRRCDSQGRRRSSSSMQRWICANPGQIRSRRPYTQLRRPELYR